MLNVPEANSPTFRKVMESLGGEDYAYYAFDVKNIENKDSKKKVQIALKVFVPQAKRALATEQIANALIDDGVNVVTKSNELDVIIPNAEEGLTDDLMRDLGLQASWSDFIDSDTNSLVAESPTPDIPDDAKATPTNPIENKGGGKESFKLSPRIPRPRTLSGTPKLAATPTSTPTTTATVTTTMQGEQEQSPGQPWQQWKVNSQDIINNSTINNDYNTHTHTNNTSGSRFTNTSDDNFEMQQRQPRKQKQQDHRRRQQKQFCE